MKKYLFLLLLTASAVIAQTGTANNAKYKMQTPVLGEAADSVVVWNGTDKFLKFRPASVFGGSQDLQQTLSNGNESDLGAKIQSLIINGGDGFRDPEDDEMLFTFYTTSENGREVSFNFGSGRGLAFAKDDFSDIDNVIIVPNDYDEFLERPIMASRQWVNAQGFGGGGAVDSVNGETGTVVLDADDISDSGTTNKWTNASEKALIATAVQPAGLAAYQPLDSDLTAIAALTTDAFGRGVLTQTTAANARTYIGAEAAQSGTGFVRKTGATTSYVATVPLTQGGTGLTAGGTANQILQMNGAGTAAAWVTNSVTANTVVNQASLPLIRTSNNISDNGSFIQAGFYQTDGVYVNVTNHLSLNKQPIGNLNPKTISGLGTIGGTAARIIFYDASNAIISVLSGAPYTSAAPFTFTPPAGTVTFAVTIINQTGVGTSPSTSPYKTSVMISEGTEILPFETFANTYIEPKKAFISLTGSDTTGDGTLGKPFRTISKATSILYWSGGEILMRGGDYPSENTNVLSYRNIKLSAYGSEVVRILNGIKVTSGTLEGGYTKVYKTTGITLPAGTLEVWQHDINDAATAITNADRHPIHKNKTHRLSSVKMVKAASLADIEASSVLKWFNIGTDFYFSKTTGSDLTVNPIVIPDQTIYVRQASVENINFQYGGLFFTNVVTDTYLKNVSSKFSNSTCFLVGGSANTASITFENCEAAGSHEDGFGLGGNARVKEINCYSHDHFDEGSSAHDDVNIERYDCYFEWNGQGAIADVGNSHSLISGCTARYGNSDIIFSHSAIGGVDTGIGIVQNTTTSGAITASVSGRVRVYNSSAFGGMNNNVTQINQVNFAVNNTTTPLTALQLNTQYPNVNPDFKVFAKDITTGAMIYVKQSEAGSSDVWLSIVATVTP